MEITWKIADMERVPEGNGVIRVHWRAEAREDSYYDSVYGDVSLTPDYQDENFIPYAELTEEIVIGWVKDALGAEKVQEYENLLAAQIERQKNPPVLPGVPWN
jgi:hypothetical protein